MTDRVDLQKLVAEAMAETPDPRAARCWGWHSWSMWQMGTFTTRFGDKTQHRRCCRCGRWQFEELKV